MSRKNFAIGTAVILFSTITVTAFVATSSALQAVNPIAALTAAIVAIIGIAWFKKTR